MGIQIKLRLQFLQWKFPARFKTTESKFTANSLVSINADLSYNIYFSESFLTIDETSSSIKSNFLLLTPSWDIISPEGKVQEVTKWLDSNHGATTEKYEAKQKELESLVNPIM